MENLNNLQSRFKLLFHENLTEYLLLVESIIKNAESFTDENVLKMGVICLRSVLKCFEYYHDDAQHPGKNADKYEEKQKICHQKYYSFFTEERIKNFFTEFVLKFLPKRVFLSQATGGTEELENFIDTGIIHEIINEFVETEKILDEGPNEIENTLFNLTLVCCQEFLMRFPEQAIPLLHGLVDQIIEGKSIKTKSNFEGTLDLSNEIQDGVFALLGLLPVVYDKKGVNQTAYYDFLKAIKYLQDKSQNINLAKRIPLLISRWVKLYPGTLIEQLY